MQSSNDWYIYYRDLGQKKDDLLPLYRLHAQTHEGTSWLKHTTTIPKDYWCPVCTCSLDLFHGLPSSYWIYLHSNQCPSYQQCLIISAVLHSHHVRNIMCFEWIDKRSNVLWDQAEHSRRSHERVQPNCLASNLLYTMPSK